MSLPSIDALSDEEHGHCPKDQAGSAEWWARHRLRHIEADPWAKKLHDLPTWTQEAHDKWRNELIVECGLNKQRRIDFQSRCLREGFAMAGYLKTWPPSPCQRFAEAPCTCHNATSQTDVAELSTPSGRREYIVEALSDEAWKLIDNALHLSNRRARAGNALSSWRTTMAAAVTWAVNECPWNRVFLKKGEPDVGTALRQRIDRLDLDRLRTLQQRLKRDTSLKVEEREHLLATTTKLIKQVSRDIKSPVKTASEAAA